MSRERMFAGELDRFLRLSALLVALILATIVVRFIVIDRVYEPAVRTTAHTQDLVDRLHSSMLDQETGVRGYLLTGNRAFLEPDSLGAANYQAALEALTAPNVSDARTRSALAATVNAADAWIYGYAEPVVAGNRLGSDLAGVLADGKAAFDAYRAAEASLAAAAQAQLSSLLSDEARTANALTALELALGVLLVAYILIRRRGLQSLVITPLRDLVDALRRIRDGELDVAIPEAGPTEVREIRRGMLELTAAVRDELERGQGREAEAVASARLARELLNLARDFVADLDLDRVTASVARAMRLLGDARSATMWLADESRQSITTAASTSPDVELGRTRSLGGDDRGGSLGRALLDGNVVTESRGGGLIVALPLARISAQLVRGNASEGWSVIAGWIMAGQPFGAPVTVLRLVAPRFQWLL